MKKKKYRMISLIRIAICVIGILSWIFGGFTEDTSHDEENQQKFFAIIPHFSIKPKSIERFYRTLKSIYNIYHNEQINIILISPDHFGTNQENIALLCRDVKKFCYKDSCVYAKPLPKVNNSDCLEEQETKEHGLGEHFTFIKKVFPKAEVFPIVVKPRKFIGNTEVIELLSGYKFKGKTLIIASVDFSHYVAEDFAKLHDKKSLYTLNTATTATEYGSLEADCPSCLHIINTLAQQNNQYPKLFLRDSSSKILNQELNTGNTSRQFIYYTAEQQKTNGFTIAFFGDLIFDRNVAKILSGDQKIQEYFTYFYQNENTETSLSTNIHRKLFGIDFVGLNLETPAINDQNICEKSGKEVSFCSNSLILPYLKNIGFTVLNVANNHSLDGGIAAHEETIENIKANKVNYIGYVKNKYFEKNYLRKTNIRGIQVARHGFDFTITPRNLFSTYCDELKKNKDDGYINMVSVHRGREYEVTHSAEQESLGRQLIDCGADIIIGHHPHVIQDIGRYQGKPIIYSLGNFLFDMNTPETKLGGYVLIDYQEGGKITISTGKVHASVY